MSANEYYGGQRPNTYNQKPLPHEPHVGSDPRYSPPSQHSINLASQNSLPNSNNYSPPLSQSNSNYQSQYPDPYADNIPLRDYGKNAQPAVSYEKPKRKPWFCWILSAIQISVFIAELVKNGILTKTPIAIKPSFNPMIGPSSYVLINMGARFVPCMQTIKGITDTPINFPCPNSTSLDVAQNLCSLSELCGFNGVPAPGSGQAPNQWWRFITPMFLHAGLLHIGFNLLLQLKLGADMEREIGPLRFSIVYFASGIFGFLLGGNFAPSGIASTGASGCLFGILALVLLDLLYSWKQREKPVRDLLFLLLDIVISFVLGLLPGLDNFSHIGGFLMGLLLGLTVLHSPDALRQRIGQSDPPYTPVHTSYNRNAGDVIGEGIMGFARQPVGFFKGRKGLWWVWWIVRAAMLTLAVIAIILLFRNFYLFRKPCKWCKYLSCLDINNWCSIGDLKIESQPPKMLLRTRQIVDLSSF